MQQQIYDSFSTNNKQWNFHIAVLVFKLISRNLFFINRKELLKTFLFFYLKLLKSRLLFEKIANFVGKLLRNCKQLEYKVFRILLKNVTDHLLVVFQFTWLYI